MCMNDKTHHTHTLQYYKIQHILLEFKLQAGQVLLVMKGLFYKCQISQWIPYYALIHICTLENLEFTRVTSQVVHNQSCLLFNSSFIYIKSLPLFVSDRLYLFNIEILYSGTGLGCQCETQSKGRQRGWKFKFQIGIQLIAKSSVLLLCPVTIPKAVSDKPF